MRMGPMEFLALTFPGEQVSTDMVGLLADVAKARDVRVVDSLLVTKRADGTVATSELPGAPEVTLIDEADAQETATALLEPSSTALLLLVEHHWLKGAAEAIRAAGGELAASVRIKPDYVEEALAGSPK